jgi:DNA-binding HxlR family transcriptional regulator
MKSVADRIAPHSEPSLSLSARMARGDLMASACPSREVLRHLTSRWGVLVLIALLPGTMRFSDLRRKVAGVSEKMLSQTLQWLEADGMIERRAFRVVPPHVEYTLTPLGLEAASKVRELADWIEVSLPRIAQHWEAVRQTDVNDEVGQMLREVDE